jgi:hypothetical protein
MGRHDAATDDDADGDGCKATWRSMRRVERQSPSPLIFKATAP